MLVEFISIRWVRAYLFLEVFQLFMLLGFGTLFEVCRVVVKESESEDNLS